MASARAELELADWRRLNGLLERGLDYTRPERQRWLSGLDTDDRHLAPLLVLVFGILFAWFSRRPQLRAAAGDARKEKSS